jgi:beta-ribofuranosylaminobenzene 5'-phosphate synthase
MKKMAVEIRAPSRLHFGLTSFGGPGRQYGGVGVMIQQPALQLRIVPSRHFEVRGDLVSRIQLAADRWATANDLLELPGASIEVAQSVPQHVGLGSGTQLALSVAAGLNCFLGRGRMSAEQLARATGRGRRSAVGTHGFVAGGLIFERGRLADELLAPLDTRLSIPDGWQFLLVRPDVPQGLSGAVERAAFSRLPPVADQVREQLLSEIETEMLPALRRQDFAAFGESVFRYGKLAGECFARVQGGAYHGKRLTQLVTYMRSLGVQGVGQSSWGPTIFALLETRRDADQLAQALRANADLGPLDTLITQPANQGVVLSTKPISAIRCRDAAPSTSRH